MDCDILSFEESGRERLIEVKTTGGGRETPFYVTRNELNASHEKETQYFLYRVFSFPRNPGMFYKQGRIGSGFTLEPAIYNAKP